MKCRFCAVIEYGVVMDGIHTDLCPNNPKNKKIKDTEQQVIADIKQRQQRGLAKYGTTVAKNPMPLREWLRHQYEELLDAAIYCKRAMQEMDK